MRKSNWMQLFTAAKLMTITASAFLISPFSGTAEEFFSASPASLFRLAIPRSLAVLGQEQVLVGRIKYNGAVEQTVRISLVCHKGRLEEKLTNRQIEKGGLKTLSTKQLRLVTNKQEVVFQTTWVPDETGEFTLVARLEPERPERWKGPLEVAQTVTVVQQALHFHYWSANTNLKYITEGMVNNTNLLDYWADRGVNAQRWVGGLCDLKREPKPTLGEMAASWARWHRKGWPGIVIDEFGGGSENDQFLGRALSRAKKMEPENYIAVYCISVTTNKGANMAEGLRKAANRVLVEAYHSNAAYHYSWIRNRYQTALNQGLAHKTLAALAFSRWITTPQELRRQLHFTRYTFPGMRGIAFFGGNNNISDDQVNEHIRRFYIEPVLRVELIDDEVRITSIGGRDAPPTRITFCGQDSKLPKVEMEVPSLKVGREYTAPLPGKSLQPQTDYSDDVLILGAPLLWDKEPPEMRPNATDEWPTTGRIAASVKKSFEEEPELEFQRDQSDKIVAAYGSLPSTEGRSFEMSFDLQPGSVWYYGSIAIGLSNTVGKSSLRLNLRRGDDQKGAYFGLSLKNEAGIGAHEHIAQIIDEGKKHRMIVRYESEGYARVSIYDHNSLKLWDTGCVPIDGQMSFDRLVFSVRSGTDCTIEWDADCQAMLLRGGGKPYMLDGVVTRFAMSVYKRKRE